MLASCAALVLMSGCYHVNVITDTDPSAMRVTKPFQMSFVAGLVPPPKILATEEGCTNGVASVHTWRSFVNMLIGGLSSNLVTPMSVEITCSSGAPTPVPETATSTKGGSEPSAKEDVAKGG
jgi:hypothetical protein